MNYWPIFLGLAAIAAVAAYRNGYAVTKSLSAVLFSFCPAQNGDTAALNSCNGWCQHVGRFRESRTYELTLDAQLAKGDVTVLLLDQGKRPLLRLTRQAPAGRIELVRQNRYYVRWEFQNATGRCALRW